jgi:hypothetical protein
VDDLVRAMGMEGVSRSQVSRLCAEIDNRVRDFLARPIEGDWPYLWLDATSAKVREAGRIVPVEVTIAVGVNADGRREVLGMAVGSSEAEPFWLDFLRSLARRGLRGVKLVVSDAHDGLKAAVTKVLRATWQRCRVHFASNALAHRKNTKESITPRRPYSSFLKYDSPAGERRPIGPAKNLASTASIDLPPPELRCHWPQLITKCPGWISTGRPDRPSTRRRKHRTTAPAEPMRSRRRVSRPAWSPAEAPRAIQPVDNCAKCWCRHPDLNRGPTDYELALLRG